MGTGGQATVGVETQVAVKVGVQAVTTLRLSHISSYSKLLHVWLHLFQLSNMVILHYYVCAYYLIPYNF